jgi:hypothetical protein
MTTSCELYRRDSFLFYFTNVLLLQRSVLTLFYDVFDQLGHHNPLQQEKGQSHYPSFCSSGLIVDLDRDSVISKRFSGVPFDKEIDLNKGCVLPGLVDGHTHPVWDGDRVHEFALKVSKTAKIH